MFFYLSVQQVEQIHDVSIRQFGGSHGVRSKELLESAVFRMQATFGGEDLYKDIFDKAAALLESLCKNHPFIDGNKRAAFTCAVTFLELNNYDIKFDKEETEKMMVKVAASKFSFEEIAKFLKENYQKYR
ncbi:type II toxin-antitoxin system death-on-curing family toxin [Candidatus Peregrinibacteria bacterium]|nr:type II toxin-antitoxin system death-on-curing family toxin [Candidatus Peregrinibacteria bacterium]